MTEDWKEYIKTVDREILTKLYKIACEQSDCTNSNEDRGSCAYCADAAESIIGEYLHLISLNN
jgi:hypothetical protein